MWFIGVEVEQETSAPPPKKNPGSAPDISSKKNAFVRVFTPTIRHFESGLFKKSGKTR